MAISEIKDCTEITERMTNIQVDAASTTSIMLEEIKRMEERLSEKNNSKQDQGYGRYRKKIQS